MHFRQQVLQGHPGSLWWTGPAAAPRASPDPCHDPQQVDIVPREERGDEPARPAAMPAGAPPYYMPPAMPGPDGALPRPTGPDPAMMMCYQQARVSLYHAEQICPCLMAVLLKHTSDGFCPSEPHDGSGH